MENQFPLQGLGGFSLFNSKELDNETGLYYYGARYLDPTGAMWLSVDPLFEKYAGMSPYNYCAGNPVKFVDPDGRENAIYVIDLQDKNREDKIDIHKTINMANLYFENLGLNTRLYEVSSEDFNPSMMNKTDSYVVVGSYDEKQKYQGRNPMKKALDFLKKHMDTNELNYSFKDWYGGGLNSERTSMIGGKQTSEMAIDGSGAYQYAKKDLKVEPESYAAFIILHGAGHNAGYSHVLSTNIPNRPLGTLYDAVIMADGVKYIDGWLRRRDVTLQKLISPKGFQFYDGGRIYNNDAYVKAIEKRYGINKSKSCF